MWVQNSISSHGKAQKWATSDHDQKRQNCHSSLKRSNPNKIFLGDLNWLQKLHLSHRHPTLHLTLCPVFQHDQKPCFCCFLLKLPKKVPNLGQNIKIYSVSIPLLLQHQLWPMRKVVQPKNQIGPLGGSIIERWFKSQIWIILRIF